METLVVQDSPLAAYLEGEGNADDTQDSTSPNPQDNSQSDTYASSFAPRGLPMYLNKLAARSLTFRRNPAGIIAKLRNICAFAVTSTLGKADNERFLEHFRYIIIASQLLDDQVGPTTSRYTSEQHQHASATDFADMGTSLTGALTSASAAFLLVYILHWARDDSGVFVFQRLLLVLLASAVMSILLYAFVRRHWLKYLRHRAVDTANAFVATVQTFENVSGSVLTFVQEVELVSRGYMISHPLPPISRLEGKGQARKCGRIRAHQNTLYLSAIHAFTSAIQTLRPSVNETDLDRFLEVYSIPEEDMSEAFVELTEKDASENESLRQLRIQQHRLSLLRRIFLCCLLSVPATGRKIDATRWLVTITQMEALIALLTELSENTSKLLSQETQFCNTPTASSPLSPSRSFSNNMNSSPTRSNHHIRRMSTFTSGIRSLQAKLYLLSQDTTRSISSSTTEPDLIQLSHSLREQYDSIGADLRALVQAWESGRKSLLEDISKQERRVSLATSSRPSTPNLGGLKIVEEDLDISTMAMDNSQASDSNWNRNSAVLSPRSAVLSRLSGGDGSNFSAPLSPPMTESGESELESSSITSGRDDEVFEAVAAPPAPRARSGLTREQRIQKMNEDRERKRLLREKSEVSTNMIRELQSVIRLRPAPSGGRKGSSNSPEADPKADKENTDPSTLDKPTAYTPIPEDPATPNGIQTPLENQTTA